MPKRKIKDENQKRENILEKAAEVFDLPGDIIAGMPRLLITGGRDALIENHKGILEYNDTEIHINGGKVVIKIKGMGLYVKAMNATEMSLSGKIFSVEFAY